jgi:hypothetical protein
MNIKKFNEFLTENKYIEITDEHGSFGQYIEKLEDMFESDEEKIERFRQIVGKYLEDSGVNPQVRISNAVNTLDELDQRLLVKELKREFELTENIDSEEVDTQEEAEQEMSEVKDMRLSGKFGFNSFLKVITALNLSDIKPNYEDCPSDFSIIYTILSIDKQRLLNIMKRFRSLDFASDIVDKCEDSVVGLYYGLKYNKQFNMEYGLVLNDKRTVCGEFKFGKGALTKMLKHPSKALNSFKELMQDCDLKRMKTLMKVKYDMDTFSPGYFHKKATPHIKGDVLTCAYYGVGKWNKGMIDKEDYQRMKQEFNDWILTQKWKKHVTFNVKPGKFWVYFKIKAK